MSISNSIKGSQEGPTVRLETHGCKLNQADTQVLARELTSAGYVVVGSDEDADVFVLNSCTVTHVADRKARQAIRSARRRNPKGLIVATGCYAQRSPEDLRAMPEIDLVAGNVDKPALVRLIGEVSAEPDVACAVGDDQTIAPMLMIRSRAMIKIQEGCDQVCAYCIVPKVRGRERSIPLDDLIDTANRYSRMGCQEIVLTGTQLGSYGFDLDGVDIADLVRALLERTDVPRIRISSLQPQDISDELLDLWSDSRLCPHFHVPLQSGSDRILSRMRRRYTAERFLSSVERIRDRVPDVTITADAIVGFPGETEDDFQRTVETCRKAGLASTHVFPYSIRPETSAAHFDEQVEPEIKRERVGQLSDVTVEMSRKVRESHVDQTRPVLWERSRLQDGALVWTGLTDNYLRTATMSDDDLSNRITDTRLLETDEDVLVGEIVRPL